MSSNVLQHQKIGFVQDLQPVSVETLNTNFNFCFDFPKSPGIAMVLFNLQMSAVETHLCSC